MTMKTFEAVESTTRPSAVRLPAEWENQQAILMAWPHADTDWAYMLDQVQKCYVDIIRAIIPYCKVVIVAPEADPVFNALSGCDSSRLRVVEVPTNDTWTRDYGVITTVDAAGTPVMNDFCFNGWGMKFAADRDNLVTRTLYFNSILRGRYNNCLGFVFEGGSIESDGEGTLLTTARCLLSPNRNGQMARRDISNYLKRVFGARKVLWLNSGELTGDDTDAHIDTLARLAPNNTILYMGCQNPADEQYDELCSMAAELKSLRNADGQPFNLLELPMPPACYDAEGNRLPATYANFLIVNGAVIMPAYGCEKTDRLACMIARVAFPGYDVIPVDCTALIQQHGSLHCATMQLPFFDL